MYDHGDKGASLHKGLGKAGSSAESERRVADRHVFTASADVVELGSGARFSTRTTDLGPGGCFIDTMVPFPVGAQVHVSVHRGKAKFETEGIVVYSQYGLGMGIAFDIMEPDQRQALDDWLADLTAGRQAHAPETQHAPQKPAANRGSDHATVVRLVQLMIGKGILTEAEGASVLHDPVL